MEKLYGEFVRCIIKNFCVSFKKSLSTNPAGIGEHQCK